jgi:hypothetical protein
MRFGKKDIIPVICGIGSVIAALLYGYRAYINYHMMQTDSFIYKGKTVKLIESDYNCGFRWDRMYERCLEMAIAKIWLEKNKENVLEIGAVSPYYFNNFTHDVCDPADEHSKVNLKTSMFNLDLRNKNVLSISTIEHIGTGEYGVAVDKNESSILALEKILRESKKCLITFPVGVNKDLEQYVFQNKFSEPMTITFFVRNSSDNDFKETKDINLIKKTKYGSVGANAVVVIEKE